MKLLQKLLQNLLNKSRDENENQVFSRHFKYYVGWGYEHTPDKVQTARFIDFYEVLDMENGTINNRLEVSYMEKSNNAWKARTPEIWDMSFEDYLNSNNLNNQSFKHMVEYELLVKEEGFKTGEVNKSKYDWSVIDEEKNPY